jgi:hypothetical protein
MEPPSALQLPFVLVPILLLITSTQNKEFSHGMLVKERTRLIRPWVSCFLIRFSTSSLDGISIKSFRNSMVWLGHFTFCLRLATGVEVV